MIAIKLKNVSAEVVSFIMDVKTYDEGKLLYLHHENKQGWYALFCGSYGVYAITSSVVLEEGAEVYMDKDEEEDLHVYIEYLAPNGEDYIGVDEKL